METYNFSDISYEGVVLSISATVTAEQIVCDDDLFDADDLVNAVVYCNGKRDYSVKTLVYLEDGKVSAKLIRDAVMRQFLCDVLIWGVSDFSLTLGNIELSTPTPEEAAPILNVYHRLDDEMIERRSFYSQYIDEMHAQDLDNGFYAARALHAM